MPQSPPPGFTIDSPSAPPPGFKIDSPTPDTPSPPGLLPRFLSAVSLPSSRKELEAAQPSTAEKIIGPAATAAKLVKDYGSNLLNEGRQLKQSLAAAPNGTGSFLQDFANVNGPPNRFVNRGVLAPVGGNAIQDNGEDAQKGNLPGAAGDILGTLVNALALRQARPTSPEAAT